MFDYDDIICPVCQHMGVLPNGGYDWICQECGYEGSLYDSDEDDDCADEEFESIFDDDGFSSQGWDDEF